MICTYDSQRCECLVRERAAVRRGAVVSCTCGRLVASGLPCGQVWMPCTCGRLVASGLPRTDGDGNHTHTQHLLWWGGNESSVQLPHVSGLLRAHRLPLGVHTPPLALLQRVHRLPLGVPSKACTLKIQPIDSPDPFTTLRISPLLSIYLHNSP